MSPHTGAGMSASRTSHAPSRPLRRAQHYRRPRPGKLTRRVAAAALPLTVLAATPPALATTPTASLGAHPVLSGASTTHTTRPSGLRASAVAPDSPLLATMAALRTLRDTTHRRGLQGPGVEAFGTAENRSGPALPADAVGVALAGHGTGYWVVDATGTVVAHGAARNYGSLDARDRAGRIVGIAAAPGARGYWLVSADGGVHSFGDAPRLGSLTGRTKSPVVGIAATGSGAGYWLATASGGVYPFGDAAFEGSPSSEGLRYHAPIVGIAAAGRGGYWVAAANGSVYEYGAAPFEGSLPSRHRSAEVTGIAATPSGRGYWLVARDGSMFPFGDAAFEGSAAPEPSSAVVTAAVATGSDGYLELSASAAALRAAQARAAAAQAAEARAAAARAAAARAARRPVRHRTPSSQGVSLGDFLVTCYDLQGTTASGAPVSTVTVAVDPSVIPMGAEIDIAGVGVRIAQDTGGAIVGHRLDIWEPTYQGCMDWGARTEPVTLLRP